jgi:opacity protein-like surface antigen
MLNGRAFVLAIALTAMATPALADATLFLGVNTTPASRLTKGAALGFGLALFGLEFEYASTSESEGDAAPSLTTGMANGLLQFPVPIFGVQPYVTAGAGLYHEELDALGDGDTDFGVNIGGGAKVSLAGPLRLRLDYRVLRLRSGALHTPAHRFYAGLNLGF